MRLILHNPQKEVFFGHTLLSVITRSHSFRKYRYLLSWLTKHNKPYAIYVDKHGSSIPSGERIPKRLEVWIWALLNGLNPLSLQIISNPEKIAKDDIFMSFTYFNLDGQNTEMHKLAKSPFIKLFHATHFIMKTKAIAKNFRQFGADFFLGENNLAKNSAYFKHHFPFYKKDVCVLPFVFEERFKDTAPFGKRKNKCFATGTVVRFKEMARYEETFKDFIAYYDTDTIHPMRSFIFENKEQLKDVIDCYIGLLWEVKRKNLKGNENVFKWLYAKLYNAFVVARRSYYKFDMVEKLNEYRMFVVPEEINDMPGIGFVEGMACGCAYIGKNDPMYTDLGLVPGKQYIAYDGTVEGLKRQITYYQKHPKELEQIAAAGKEFIRSTLNGDAVAARFWKDLEALSEQLKRHKYDKSRLSFQSSLVQRRGTE